MIQRLNTNDICKDKTSNEYKIALGYLKTIILGLSNNKISKVVKERKQLQQIDANIYNKIVKLIDKSDGMQMMLDTESRKQIIQSYIDELENCKVYTQNVTPSCSGSNNEEFIKCICDTTHKDDYVNYLKEYKDSKK